jgi:hypothetical protein
MFAWAGASFGSFSAIADRTAPAEQHGAATLGIKNHRVRGRHGGREAGFLMR